MSILMIIPFAILTIISLLFYNVCDYDMGEGMTLSTVIVIASIYLSNICFGNSILGFCAIAGLLVISFCVAFLKTPFIQKFVTKSKHDMEETPFHIRHAINPYLMFLIIITIFLCCIYHNDFIQNIDEFHQWAAVPKYMLEHHSLPENISYIRRDSSFATSIFIYFFQSFTGYNEGLMYVVGNLLYWIGFLLPFGSTIRKDWKKVGVFALITYLSLYTLYMYGAKNLYVDISVAAWSAGLFGWISNQETFKLSKLPIFIGSVFLIYNMKTSLGRSMVIIVCGFYVIRFIYLKLSIEKKKYLIYGLTAFNLLSLIFISLFVSFVYQNDLNDYVPDRIGVYIRSSGYSQQKLLDLSNMFIKRILGSFLGSTNSPLKISFLTALIVCGIIFYIVSQIYEDSKEYVVYTLFFLGSTIVYLFILWAGFLFVFGYELGSRATSFPRYGSIFIIAVLSFALFKLINSLDVKQSNLTKGLTMALLILFAYGIDGKYITTSTTFDKENIVGYEQITNTKEQVQIIKNLIRNTDKVYMIDQSFGTIEDQYVTDTAMYYLEDQISDNQREPYMFTTFGSYIGLNECGSPGITDLKSILTEKRYEYVWINRCNDYLKKYLPAVMGDEKLDQYGEEKKSEHHYKSNYIQKNTMHDCQLYRVVYINGKASKLKLVNNIINYDVRQK